MGQNKLAKRKQARSSPPTATVDDSSAPRIRKLSSRMLPGLVIAMSAGFALVFANLKIVTLED